MRVLEITVGGNNRQSESDLSAVTNIRGRAFVIVKRVIVDRCYASVLYHIFSPCSVSFKKCIYCRKKSILIAAKLQKKDMLERDEDMTLQKERYWRIFYNSQFTW